MGAWHNIDPPEVSSGVDGLTWSSITPVSITAVFMLSLASSRAALESNGNIGEAVNLGGRGVGNIRIAISAMTMFELTWEDLAQLCICNRSEQH